MLTESQVRQIHGEPKRRWFSDEDLDLILWQDRLERITAFQLCYDLGRDERALTWKLDQGYSHQRVDSGEDGREHAHKATPILTADGEFDPQQVAVLFKERSGKLDPPIREFIHNKILEYRSQPTKKDPPA